MGDILKLFSNRRMIQLFIFSLINNCIRYIEPLILAKYLFNPITSEKILELIILLLITKLIEYVFFLVNEYKMSIFYYDCKVELKKNYLFLLQKVNTQKLTNIHTGTIQNLIDGTIELSIEVIFGFLSNLLASIIASILLIVNLINSSAIMVVIAIIIMILGVYIKYRFIKIQERTQIEATKVESEFEGLFSDFLLNILTIKKLNLLNFCNNKIDKTAKKLSEKNIKNQNYRTLSNGSLNLFSTIQYIIIFVFVMIQLKNGMDVLPIIVFYISLFPRLFEVLNGLVYFFDDYKRFKIKKAQLDAYLEINEDEKTLYGFNKLSIKNGEFSYGENNILIEIPDFEINKNDKISIVGKSGQGKTTFLNIIAGFYKLIRGDYLIDNKISNKKLNIAFITQDIELFNLSIRENLILDKEIDDKILIELLKKLDLEEWYNKLPNGLDTVIGERGVKISGGQKQRLNILRGILMDKDIYLFDEPTSNLDEKTEENVLKLIEESLKDKTYIIVTHRKNAKNICNKHYEFKKYILKEEN